MARRAKVIIGLLIGAIMTACTVQYKKVKYKSRELKIENKLKIDKPKKQ
jgi:hypothetical protein